MFLGSRALRALQISLKVAYEAGTQHMMLHSEFCAVWPSLSKVAGKRIWLINIHSELLPATLRGRWPVPRWQKGGKLNKAQGNQTCDFRTKTFRKCR